MSEKGICRSCGAAVLWVRSATTGALMPLDAVPCEDGNISLVVGMAHVHHGSLFEEMLPEGPRFKSHFATCPSAASHRKPKEKKP
jgi:hypothetical protein